MPETDPGAGLFPALLKYWRTRRGLSQLDLALAADVSSRHVSFLETGRSNPSAQMVLRLAASLDVPLRHANAMLKAAGHPRHYPEGAAQLPPEIAAALDLMKAHHDPFPLIVVDRSYRVVDLNRGAEALLGAAIPQATSWAGLNLARLTFDPQGAQPAIANFAEVGRQLLWRIQREVLADPDDGPLRELLEEVLAMPTVDDGWREADFAAPSSPTLGIHLRAGDRELSFTTMVTAFQAPQSVFVDELRIESWFPTDATTAELCRAMADGG
jgi:transcriptional regulator with XRE-family HTH domain